MKYILLLFLYLLQAVAGLTQGSETYNQYARYFEEIKTAAAKNTWLWNSNLYSAILLVDPHTRQVIANEADPAGQLKKHGTVYTGLLPENVNIANTAVKWNDKHWAMIMLPLPIDENDRINLLAHELFHKAQPQLGFVLHDPQNNHLDQKNGRLFLRLELEALKKVLEAKSSHEQRQHLQHAFFFRKHRYTLYPGADSTENLLELNEGLAEYTGLMTSNRNKQETIRHFIKEINLFMTNPTYVRSFAYHTVPVYGYLLHHLKKNRGLRVTAHSNLTAYLTEAFGIRLPGHSEKAVGSISRMYDGSRILHEETAREEKIKEMLTAYKNKFILQPHTEIGFEQMNISFDPRNIVPLEGYGTVYPHVRVTDNWGILTVEKDALITRQWDRILLSNPEKTEGNKITGEGWTLELAEGYNITKQENGNYRLVKKQ